MKFQHVVCMLLVFAAMMGMYISLYPTGTVSDADRICRGLASVTCAVLSCSVSLFYGPKEPDE